MSEFLFKGGCVLTMDDALGDLPSGDVLVRGDRIVAVGPSIEASGAQVIDATGHVVIPGLIDGHRHGWQSLLRGAAGDWSFLQYMTEARALYCGCFDPEDAYIANYLCGLESIDAGITSIVDHSHLQSTPEVSTALARGLKDSGVGGVFCYALQNVPYFVDGPPPTVPSVKDILFRDPDAWHDAHAAGLRDTDFAEGPLRFGVALPEVAPYVPAAYAAQLFARATALRPVLLTGHWNATERDGAYTSSLAHLVDEGAFVTKTLLTHVNQANDADLRRMIQSGVGLCTCPDIEAGMGLGRLLAPHFVAMGGDACLGIDVTCYAGVDLLAQARAMLQEKRREDAAAAGSPPPTLGYKARSALELLTSKAAHAIGQGDEIGTIAVGKRADLVMIASDPVHAAPLADPVATLLFHTGKAQVDTVMVAGKVLKQSGRLTGVDLSGLRSKTRAAAARVQDRYERLPKAELQTVWEGVF